MQLLDSHAAWGCLLTSAAMVLGKTNAEMIELIGHDGGAIVFDGMPGPTKRQGFHIQEVIKVALALGVAVTAIEVLPCSTTDGKNNFDILFRDTPAERLGWHMNNSIGIITGQGRRFPHAVAWDGARIFDPQGRIYGFDDIKIGVQVYYRFDKIKS